MADLPPSLSFAATALVLAVSTAVAVPFAIARGGPALVARLGQGRQGFFIPGAARAPRPATGSASSSRVTARRGTRF